MGRRILLGIIEMRKIIKNITAGILAAISLFSITSCGTGMEKLESEKQALQQQIEALEQQNFSIQADTEELQKGIDEIFANQQLIEDYQEIIERQELYGAPLEAGFKINETYFSNRKEKTATAVKADRSVFDINDVRLTVYWGTDFAEEDFEELSCDAYSIAFPGIMFSPIEIGEDLYAEKNRAEFISNNGFVEVKYRRSMEVVIPAEAFYTNDGRFFIDIYKHKGNTTSNVLGVMASLFYYKSEDGTKVYLYNEFI